MVRTATHPYRHQTPRLVGIKRGARIISHGRTGSVVEVVDTDLIKVRWDFPLTIKGQWTLDSCIKAEEATVQP